MALGAYRFRKDARRLERHSTARGRNAAVRRQICTRDGGAGPQSRTTRVSQHSPRQWGLQPENFRRNSRMIASASDPREDPRSLSLRLY
eukprot:1823898-Rhodomonas_salina.3